jgi:hypothetical protein
MASTMENIFQGSRQTEKSLYNTCQHGNGSVDRDASKYEISWNYSYCLFYNLISLIILNTSGVVNKYVTESVKPGRVRKL